MERYTIACNISARLAPLQGLEPRTSSSVVRRSKSAELQRHGVVLRNPSRTRTEDRRIKSPLLYTTELRGHAPALARLTGRSHLEPAGLCPRQELNLHALRSTRT